MNSRKRPADDIISRPAKQPRLTAEHPLGGNSSPSQNEGISARWLGLAMEFVKLTRETVAQWLDSSATKDTLPVAGPSRPRQPVCQPQQQVPPPSSPPPPPRRPARPPLPPQFQHAGPSQEPSAPQPLRLHVPPPAEGSTSTARRSRSRARRTSDPHASQVQQQQQQPPPPLPRSRTMSHLSPALLAASPHLKAAIAEHRQAQSQPRPTYIIREHILEKQHKARVKEIRRKDREEMEKELFEIRRSKGYSSGLEDFRSLLDYSARLEMLSRREALHPSPSLADLRLKGSEEPSPKRHSADDFLRRALEKAKASFAEPKPPPPFTPSLELLMRLKHKRDEEIERRLRGPKLPPLPTVLPPEDDRQVDELLSKHGVISKIEREQVTDKDLMRLRPNKWLNDEIINFYGQLILTRSEEGKENFVKNSKKPLDVHYFSTFFWSKLENEGYEKGRLAKWTKKVDIFQKDVVLIPVNHGNSHWTAAAINFRQKRIESYDSMGIVRPNVFRLLRAYLDAEHKNKKKKPFDFTGWQDYVLEDVPLQENGYDCGVFTCQFLEALSRGEEPFRFQQAHMPYLRRRMVWEIGHAKLRDDT